jgi:hypothetical protein
MPRWRLVAGGLAGPIGAWCYGIGFWQLDVASATSKPGNDDRRYRRRCLHRVLGGERRDESHPVRPLLKR